MVRLRESSALGSETPTKPDQDEGTAPKKLPQAPPRGGRGEGRPKAGWQGRLESDITGLLVSVGAAASVMLPFTGYHFVREAPSRAGALISLAERDDRIRKALERIVKVSVLGTLAGAVAETGATVGVDLGRIDPQATPLQLMGVTESYQQWLESLPEDQREAYLAQGNGQAPGGGSEGLLGELEGVPQA